MSSGSIDAQERAELEAAEKGIPLPRPTTYKRQLLHCSNGCSNADDIQQAMRHTNE